MKKQLISLACVLLAVCMLAACSTAPDSTAQPKDYVAGHCGRAQQ